jgi:hypothetical protein
MKTHIYHNARYALSTKIRFKMPLFAHAVCGSNKPLFIQKALLVNRGYYELTCVVCDELTIAEPICSICDK